MRRAQCSCVVVLLGAVLACDAGPAGLHHRRDPGALVVAHAADVTGLDLVRVIDHESIEVGEILFEGLTRWQPGTTNVEPGLATAWQVSADGLRWTFELRPDVWFHDGTALDAGAVVFSFERVIDPRHPSYVGGEAAPYWRGLLKDVKRVTAQGPARVEIDVAHPYAPLLGDLAIFPIVSPAAVRRWGPEFGRHPVGTGAFGFESWDTGEQVVVRRFERYWGQAPALERLVFRVVLDARQRLVDLQSGSVDLAAAILPDEQSFVELHPDLELLHTPGNDVSYLAFNMMHPPFDDLRVRRAISHAINKEPIVKLAYQGLAIPADGPLPPTQWGYHKPRKTYPYDPEEARKLLADAQARGVWDPAKVLRFYVPSTPRPYLPSPERIAQAIQANLAEVGIQTEIVLQPFSDHLRSTRNGEHELCLLGWVGDNGDPDNFLQQLDRDRTQLGNAINVAFYRDGMVHSLLVDAQEATDRLERERLYARVQEQIAEDEPWVPLAHSQVAIAAHDDISGLILNPTGQVIYRAVTRNRR